jgi:hypothetical protein
VDFGSEARLAKCENQKVKNYIKSSTFPSLELNSQEYCSISKRSFPIG